MKNTHSVLAIDIGTSSVRAVLFDTQGHPVPGAEARSTYQVHYTSDGGCEIPADELFSWVLQTISSCQAQVAAADVIGVGISCFWHSLVGITPDTCAPATPVYLWADTRSRGVLDEIKELEAEAELFARTGCRVHTTYWPAKIRWIKASQPSLHFSALWWMSFAEYLGLRLFGERVVSVSMASGTGVFHQELGHWDPPTLDLCGLTQSQLSTIAPDTLCFSGERLRALYKEQLGRLTSAQWFLSLGDGACSNLGSGPPCQTAAVLNLGTSAALRLSIPETFQKLKTPALARQLFTGGLWQYRIDQQWHLVGGALSNAGNLLGWLREVLNLPSTAEINQFLSDSIPDSHGLSCLPFLAGERSPGWSADTFGLVAGLHFQTTPLQLVQATIETIALRLAWILENLHLAGFPIDHIIASGGALTAFPAWAQIICDALNRPVLRLENAEVSARGAALWVFHQLGLQDLAQSQIPASTLFTPDPARHHIYRQALAHHQQFYHTFRHQPVRPARPNRLPSS
ncbi:MAG TPA: gluconokinase [Acidobacteriota bacterium]|nr:gluconokinase [Acidobacteriota bacterium]